MTLAAPARTVAPPRDRHRGLFWLAAVIATFALVGGGYTAISAYLSNAQPADVALAYFTAVSRGDAARALSYGSVPAGNRAFLTADTLADQLELGRIDDVDVLSVVRDGANASTVNLSYRLRAPDDESRVITDAVPMEHVGRHWRLTQSAVSTRVALAQAQRRVTFAGTAVPTGVVLLFPGALPIKFDTPNLELGPANSSVQFSPSDNTGLVVEASPAGITAARALVVAGLRACLAATSTDPFCPVPGNGSDTGSGSVRAVPGSLRGTVGADVANSLAVTVSPDPNGVLVVAGNISVNGQYLALNYTNIATVATNPSIAVALSAQCYASAPTALTWKGQ
jgi:hypothetical protein